MRSATSRRLFVEPAFGFVTKGAEGVAHFDELVLEGGVVAGEAVADVLTFGAGALDPPGQAAGHEQ